VLPADCLCVEHRTVRWHGLSGAHTPDCPVHQGTTAQRLVPGGTRREDHWTVRCEHQTVRCGKPVAPTVTCSDRATTRHTGQATVRCPMHHWTVRYTTGLSGMPQRTVAFLQRLFWTWGLYILHPTGHLKVWEPKQNTKAYSAHFQELKHLSA
jgi:nitrite reductase/ring-hydroxylating ferredoxin subunit